MDSKVVVESVKRFKFYLVDAPVPTVGIALGVNSCVALSVTASVDL